MTYNDQYPSRQEIKEAHQAADNIGLNRDSFTLKPLVVEFIKLKETIARYDIKTGRIAVINNQNTKQAQQSGIK